MNDLRLVRVINKRKISDYRSVESIVNSELFESFWERNPELHDAAKLMAEWGDKQGLREIINRNLQLTLEELSLRALQFRARVLHISNYSRLNRSELIDKLRKRQDVEDKRQTEANRLDAQSSNRRDDCQDLSQS